MNHYSILTMVGNSYSPLYFNYRINWVTEMVIWNLKLQPSHPITRLQEYRITTGYNIEMIIF